MLCHSGLCCAMWNYFSAPCFWWGPQLIPFSGTNTQGAWLMCNSYTKPVSLLVHKTGIFTSLPGIYRWSCSALPYLGPAKQACTVELSAFVHSPGGPQCSIRKQRLSLWAQILAKAAVSAMPVSMAELGMLSRNTWAAFWGTKLLLSDQAAMSGDVL